MRTSAAVVPAVAAAGHTSAAAEDTHTFVAEDTHTFVAEDTHTFVACTPAASAAEDTRRLLLLAEKRLLFPSSSEEPNMLRLHRCFLLVQSRLLLVLTPALLLPLFEHRRERSCPPQLGFVDPRPPFRIRRSLPPVPVLAAGYCARRLLLLAGKRLLFPSCSTHKLSTRLRENLEVKKKETSQQTLNPGVEEKLAPLWFWLRAQVPPTM